MVELLSKAKDLITLQYKLSLFPNNGEFNDNVTIENVDGQVTSVDSMIWPDEPSPSGPEPKSILTPDEQMQVDAILERFQSLFEDKPAGNAKVDPIKVQWKPGWKRPPMEPFRRYSPKIQKALDVELTEMIDRWVVALSNASVGCAAHAVSKPDNANGIRFTIDYKSINPGAENTPFPMPKVSDILNSTSGSRYFARLDLRAGYW